MLSTERPDIERCLFSSAIGVVANIYRIEEVFNIIEHIKLLSLAIEKF